MGYMSGLLLCVLLCTNQIYYVRIVAVCVMHARTRHDMELELIQCEHPCESVTLIDIDSWIGVNCIIDEKFLNVLIPKNDSKSECMLM